MIFKRLTAAVLAAASLCCATAAFAQENTIISPQTYITDSVIGDLNIYNNIVSQHFGSSRADGQSEIIMPTTLISDVNATLVNIINNIVDINVNIDMSDLPNMISQYQNAIAGTVNN